VTSRAATASDTQRVPSKRARLVTWSVVSTLGRPLQVYQQLRARCAGIPLVHAAHVPHDENLPHAHALTSTILFNGTTVSKIYAPGLLPRIIYWLAFQAEFPYMRNQVALRAAVLRRNLAGLLTEYWYGTNRVARAIGIDQIDGRLAITSAYVDGHPPTNQQAAHDFLFDLANRFDAVGLPTWQVDPRQPRALDNLRETPAGVYQILDLESGQVSPLASPRAWWRAFQRGLVPIYDDVYFDLTRAYVEREAAAMRAERGERWLATLRATLDDAEIAARAWQTSEPRVWGRLARRLQLSMRKPAWVTDCRFMPDNLIGGYSDDGEH
jgi:hypothetical protein